jgi:hypothetical protein
MLDGAPPQIIRHFMSACGIFLERQAARAVKRKTFRAAASRAR